MGSASWKTRMAALGMVVVVATTGGGLQLHQLHDHHHHDRLHGQLGIVGRGPSPPVPTVTTPASPPRTVDVGNVSTLAIGGLFKGALVGTEAYADYVNSTGGVNGRKIVVNGADDGYTGTGNKQATQNAVNTDAALVGGFSTFDSFGGQVLAQNPGVPDVTQVLEPGHQHAAQRLQRRPPRGRLGGRRALQYFKHKFGTADRAEGGHAHGRPAVDPGRLGGREVRHAEGRLQDHLRRRATPTPRPTSPRTSSP